MPDINTALVGPLPYMQREDNSYIPQSFMQAYSIAKEQNDPLRALKAAQIDQEMRARSIEISNAMTQRENNIQAMKGAAKLAEMTGEIASNGLWDDPQAQGAFWGMVKQYPAVVATPQFKESLAQFEIARKAKDKQEELNLKQAELGVSQQRADAYTDAETSRGEYWRAQAKKADQAGSDAELELVEQDGIKWWKNKKTGALHKISGFQSKPEFISKNVSLWMREQMIDENEAAKRLGEFYDNKIAPAANPSKPPTATTPTAQPKPAVKVHVKHPDGRTGYIPADQLQQAIAQGFKQIQ